MKKKAQHSDKEPSNKAIIIRTIIATASGEISSISLSKAFQSSSSELFSLCRNGNNRRMSKNRNRNAIKRVSQKKQLFDEAHLMSFAIVSRRSRILFLEQRFHSGISICKSSLSQPSGVLEKTNRLVLFATAYKNENRHRRRRQDKNKAECFRSLSLTRADIFLESPNR